MLKIKKGIVVPSAAYAVKPRFIKFYKKIPDHKPQMGDIIFGRINSIGEHSNLENKSARIHMIHNGSFGIFVYGNRYAPDFYEGVVPKKNLDHVDLLARSGVVGEVTIKNSMRKDPTTIEVLGYVCTEDGKVVNTRDHSIINPKYTVKKFPRSKLILVCGTSMNSGKSMAATACCWSLSTMGYRVRAAKATGTASLKDILSMNDAGAEYYSDFTYNGYPSSYKLTEKQVIDIFNKIDLKFANNPKNYWVVELADGILQRETALLLQCDDVRSRIHKLIFCSYDAFGAIGGLQVLTEKFNLVPDAISGVCSSSPLHIKEMSEFTNIPVFNSAEADLEQMKNILTSRRKIKV